MPMTNAEDRERRIDRIDRVVRAVESLASAVAAYQIATEHDSMSGTWDEERELRDALSEVLP